MPGTNPSGDKWLPERLRDLERRIKALETQQQFVITDPRVGSLEREGDPTRGYAVAVIGSLATVGIDAFGIAVFGSGEWVQL